MSESDAMMARLDMSESDAMMARLVRQLELGRRRLAEEVGENQPIHIPEQVYKKDADRTLLPRLKELYEICLLYTSPSPRDP